MKAQAPASSGPELPFGVPSWHCETTRSRCAFSLISVVKALDHEFTRSRLKIATRNADYHCPSISGLFVLLLMRSSGLDFKLTSEMIRKRLRDDA